MTNEEIEKKTGDALLLFIAEAFDDEPSGYDLKLMERRLTEFVRDLVLQAYEEAARIAESPDTPHEQVWESCDVPDAIREGAAKAIRALKDSLQPVTASASSTS
jgi:hypothetical protein